MLRPCPCCHSFETESVRSAYQRGVHRVRGAAADLAPPKKRRVVVLLALLALTLFALAMRVALAAAAAPDGPGRLGAGSGITGGLIFLLVIAFGLMRAGRYNRTVWPAAMREWESKFYCRACRYVFAPGEPWPVATPRAAQEETTAVLPRA